MGPVGNQDIIRNISPHGIAVEIFNEGSILARTTSQATQIILRLRPIRKKRRVCDPHQINAQDGTLARRPLPFRTHRCNVQKDHSQNAERNVPQTPDQSESFRYPGPISLRPREKIQEQHQTQQLGTQKQTLVNHKYVFSFLYLTLSLSPTSITTHYSITHTGQR